MQKIKIKWYYREETYNGGTLATKSNHIPVGDPQPGK